VGGDMLIISISLIELDGNMQIKLVLMINVGGGIQIKSTSLAVINGLRYSNQI